MQELSEPGDDQKRVVDADAEPDHRHQDLGDRVEVREPRGEEQDQEGAQHRDDREEQRDRRRHESAEEDEQDHEGCEQPDQVADALRRRCALRLTGELDLDAGRVADGAQLILERHDPGPRQLERVAVVLHVEERDPAVVGQLARVLQGARDLLQVLRVLRERVLRRLAGDEHAVDELCPGG